MRPPTRRHSSYEILRSSSQRWGALALAAGLLAAAQACSAPPPDGDGVLAIEGVTVVAMDGRPPRPDATVLVEGDRIVAVEDAAAAAVPAGARRIDGRGRYLIPGLWDMHVHALQPEYRYLLFPLLIAHGVTGIRDMNGPTPLAELHELRRAIAAGSVLGPRFVAPGPLVDGPGRPPSALGPEVLAVATAGEARAAVASLAEQGADFVKVYNRLTPELLAAILDEAWRLDLRVAGHLPLAVPAEQASDGGMVSFEHLGGLVESASPLAGRLRELTRATLDRQARGEPLGPKAVDAFVALRAEVFATWSESAAEVLAARLATNRTWQCPTLVSNRALLLTGLDDGLEGDDPRLSFVPEPIAATWETPNALVAMDPPELRRRRFRRLVGLVGLLHRHGVPLLAGTDLGTAWIFAGSSLHDELGLLVKAGLTAEEALATATRRPAEFLGLGEVLGTIEPGKLADLVLLDADPLADADNVRRIRAVVVAGRLLDRAALDGLLATGKAAAKALADDG